MPVKNRETYHDVPRNISESNEGFGSKISGKACNSTTVLRWLKLTKTGWL